jgi:xanthine dehydrogenase accessory factor
VDSVDVGYDLSVDSGALTVVVRGIGDVGSAIAHRLFVAGYALVIHDEPMPTTTRRGMAFADAVFDGSAILETVHAVRAHDLARVNEALAHHHAIPVYVRDLGPLLAAVHPDILVDARMRKHAEAEVQRGLAHLTIGLGPSLVAGRHADVLVETSWEHLGAVIVDGASLPLAGEPRELGGHARDRYVYAPVDGIFRTRARIGDVVREGQVIAEIGAMALTAPLEGILRGLTHDGVPVTVRTKVIEVDPRGSDAEVRGIGERPRRIAEGVLKAIRAWAAVPDQRTRRA